MGDGDGDRRSDSSSGEEDGDADWMAAISSVTSSSAAANGSNGLPPSSSNGGAAHEDENGKRNPPKLKLYQIKARKLLEDILDKTIEVVSLSERAPTMVEEDPAAEDTGVRLFRSAPRGIVFDHREELIGPKKRPRIVPGEELDEKSKKLDRTNYAFWRAQVLPTIRAHGFDEFIAATGMPPPPFLPSPSGVTPRSNPEYSAWIRKDQFLLSWLLASIGDTMLGHVVRCNNARDVWLTLERLFFSQSKARTMQLRMALQTTRKGSMSIEEYFLKMRGFADQLSAVGQIVTDEDLQMYILAGFGMEYEALVVNFMQRTDAPSLQEMQLAFQAYELRIAHQVGQFAVLDPSANAAFYGGGRGALGKGSGGNRSGFNKTSGAKSILCQLCGKIGHVAVKCFRRFDVYFTGANAAEFAPLQAYAVDGLSQEIGGESTTWYMDSGATNHITNELGNLSLNNEYHGSETVMVGNGQGNRKDFTEGQSC